MNDNIYFDPGDVQRNKALVIVSLLFGFTFFLPLVACPNSSFGRFYANQGLLLFVTSLINSFFIVKLPVVGLLLGGVLGFAVLVCYIIEIIGAAQGIAKRVPVLGMIELIK